MPSTSPVRAEPEPIAIAAHPPRGIHGEDRTAGLFGRLPLGLFEQRQVIDGAIVRRVMTLDVGKRRAAIVVGQTRDEGRQFLTRIVRRGVLRRRSIRSRLVVHVTGMRIGWRIGRRLRGWLGRLREPRGRGREQHQQDKVRDEPKRSRGLDHSSTLTSRNMPDSMRYSRWQ